MALIKANLCQLLNIFEIYLVRQSLLTHETVEIGKLLYGLRGRGTEVAIVI